MTATARESGTRTGVDVGGTKVEVVVTDATGTVLSSSRVPTVPGPEGVVASVVEAVVRAREGLPGDVSGPGCEDVEAPVGVGVPGVVHAATGTVRHAVNVGLVDVDLGRALEQALGRPVVLENDVTAAALAVRRRHARDATSLAFLSVGTGLAAGFVLDGRPWAGATGGAGEIGHVPWRGDEACPCGQRGCLELVASGRGLARHRAQGAPNPEGNLVEGLAHAVLSLVLTTDVERVALGGGVVAALPHLVPAVRDELRRREISSPFLAATAPADRVFGVDPGLPLGALGAALLPDARRASGPARSAPSPVPATGVVR